jgi:hypothetical protein
MQDLVDQPEFLLDLLEICTQLITRWNFLAL